MNNSKLDKLAADLADCLDFGRWVEARSLLAELRAEVDAQVKTAGVDALLPYYRAINAADSELAA